MSSPTLVNIGTHSLALYPHGPAPTNPHDPVVLFVTGVASSSLVWSATTRLLPSTLRSYTYDRSGFGASEDSPAPPTAENIAMELSLLISKANITNPIILVGHSWAGILIREFLLLDSAKEKIAGVVFVDANHPTTPLILDPNNANLRAMAAGVDWLSAQGLRTEHKFTSEEWSAFLASEATERYQKIADAEENEYAPSFPLLRSKELEKGQHSLLGDRPVYVIGGSRRRDWSGLYRAGMERGNGTEEERRGALELIATADEKSAGLMREHLKISSRGRLVFAERSGHFVQVTEPEVVVEGVKWVLSEIRGEA